MPNIFSRFKKGWNAFLNRDPTEDYSGNYTGVASYYNPSRPHLTNGNERSIINGVYNRIATDCSAISIVHAELDDNGRFVKEVDSGLNRCLTLEANKDQVGRDFIQDIVMSMLDEGVVACVPIDTDRSIIRHDSFDILSMRTARIDTWWPDHVRVYVYNDKTGNKEYLTFPKRDVAIIYNPFYSIMNEPNSTLQRLIKKLNLLDAIDEQSGAGKLDLIIQLPYIVKSEARKAQAEERRKEIENQLAGSKYGIAYTDGTEHITQLNRSVDNNLMKQIEYLTTMLYSQLGLSTSIMDGTADEKEMLNYYNRTIEPILSAITDELKRKFLSDEDRSDKQSIVFFRSPFKLVPVSQLADIADKFTRNEIMSSNEIRQIIGMKPVQDIRADELRNKNLNESGNAEYATVSEDANNLFNKEITNENEV